MNDEVRSVPPQLTPWRPGQSGNPRGVSREQHTIAARVRKAAADLTPEALLFLRDAWRNPKLRWTDRIAAAKGVLACGHADVDKLAALDPELTIIIATSAVEPAPMAGVLSHPDPRWIGSPAPADKK